MKSDANKIKLIRIGKKTRNQDNAGTPALQIRFNIHVHKRIIMILIINNMNVLDTLHE